MEVYTATEFHILNVLDFLTCSTKLQNTNLTITFLLAIFH